MQSERIELRPFVSAHADPIFEDLSDPEVMRFMHIRPLASQGEVSAFFEHDLKAGAIYWTITWAGGEVPLGFVHLLGGTQVPGMGYLIRKKFWNRGLATEALGLALDHVFAERDLDRVELWINEANGASLRVAEKLGFRPKGRIHQRYDWEENHHIMLTFGMRASEWRTASANVPQPGPQVFNVQPVLVCADVPAAIRFYRDSLGFSVDFTVGDPPVHAGVALGDWSSESANIQLASAPERAAVASPGRMYFMADARIDELHETFVSNGVEIQDPPETHPWGMREFSLVDPNGHVLRFGTRDAG
jgi:RimJ/RimL family protein N-acetyltransferase/uncharacterized glyoxalase superfamily protein PhnB